MIRLALLTLKFKQWGEGVESLSVWHLSGFVFALIRLQARVDATVSASVVSPPVTNPLSFRMAIHK